MYNAQLTAQEKDFFFSLMQDTSLIDLVYRSHCSSIILALRNKVLSDDMSLIVDDSLLLNELLLEIYELLDERDKIKRLRLEKEIISCALLSDGEHAYIELPSIFHPPPQITFTKLIEDKTKEYDFWRRLLGRIQRLCMLAIPIFEGAANWVWLLGTVSEIFKFASRLINVIFFLPRLLLNTFYLLKHVIPGTWMSEREQSVPCFIRLKTYLDIELRGYTLLSDVVLVCAAILTCFVCVGSWSFLALYLNIVLQCTEFLLSLSAMLQELQRLERFSLGHCSFSIFAENKLEAPKNIFLQSLEAHLLHEQSGRLLTVVARCCLAVCAFTLLPPAAVIGIWIPFLAAILSCLLIIVRAPAIRPYMQASCPESDLFQLVNNAFSSVDDAFSVEDNYCFQGNLNLFEKRN